MDTDLISAYQAHLKSRRLGERTIAGEIERVERFAVWLQQCEPHGRCEPHGQLSLMEAETDDLGRYYEHVSLARRPNQEPPAIPYRQTHLRTVRRFYRFLKLHEMIWTDPFADLPPLRKTDRLPRHVLTTDQALLLLRQPRADTNNGLRDRAMLELLYSSGIRGAELCNLTIHDISFDERILRIVQGKGLKDRLVPFGKTAAYYLQLYIDHVRSLIIKSLKLGGSKGWLVAGTRIWLTQFGRPYSVKALWRMVTRYAKAAGLDKVAVHSLRHACATDMLRGGASIRHVQEMLGHACINTTQIYTRLLIDDLQKVHAKTSPSERRKGRAVSGFSWAAWNSKPRKKKQLGKKR